MFSKLERGIQNKVQGFVKEKYQSSLANVFFFPQLKILERSIMYNLFLYKVHRSTKASKYGILT